LDYFKSPRIQTKNISLPKNTLFEDKNNFIWCFWLNSKSIIFLLYILPNVYFSVNKTEQEGNIRAILLVQPIVPSYLLKFWLYAQVWQIYPGVHYKLKTFLHLLNSSSKCNKMSYDWKHMKYNFKLVCISDLLFDW